MKWSILISPPAKKQAKKLGRTAEIEIIEYLETRVATADDPRQMGKPLSADLKGFWRYRVGDYRIVCEIQDQKLIVLVVKVGHRRDIYR